MEENLDLRREVKEVFCKKTYYICLDGEGDPKVNEEYDKGIEALYTLANKLKFYYKSEEMLLNTLWWSRDKDELNNDNRQNWCWRLMIEISSSISEEIFNDVKEEVSKENTERVKKIKIMEMNEGISFEVIHNGSLEDKYKSIEKLYNKIQEEGVTKIGFLHEIHLSNPIGEEKDKLISIIRQPVFKEKEIQLDYNEEKSKFFKLLGETKIMVLATSNNNKVSARNMSVVVSGESLYFQTDWNFEKCRDIDVNKNIALCVDNIQIEGRVDHIGSILDEEFSDFKRIFKEKHRGSYDAYSKLMENRVFRVEINKVSLYKYDNKDVFRVFIDFIKKTSYKRWYLRN